MYLTFKSLHIIFVVCWFAALFYLPRLFVYHAIAEKNGDKKVCEYFEVMERRLYIIGNIGLVLLTIFAILILFYVPSYLKMGWLHLKIFLFLILAGYYGYCGKIIKLFKNGQNTHDHKFYRYFNEFPSIILILCCFLAVLKNF